MKKPEVIVCRSLTSPDPFAWDVLVNGSAVVTFATEREASAFARGFRERAKGD